MYPLYFNLPKNPIHEYNSIMARAYIGLMLSKIERTSSKKEREELYDSLINNLTK